MLPGVREVPHPFFCARGRVNLLAYKLTIAPALVALATLAGRRWGAAAAGLVAGLPIVSGPLLFFYAVEQGPVYASDAALATLLGLLALCAFVLAYAWRAWSGGSALSSVALGWVAFALVTLLVNRLLDAHAVSLGRALLYALLALFLSLRSLPPEAPVPDGESAVPAGFSGAPRPGAGDLALRMLAAALLVWALTSFAQRLGPRLGGLLTPFPVASTVLAVFAHLQGGSPGVRAVLKGLLLALNAFAVFCAVLAAALVAWGVGPSFGAALLCAGLVQAAVLALPRRRRA